jgi:putative ABC transport system permease protein
METLIHDILFGIRNLLKQPMFSGIAIVTLVLGIGANTAIFSVVNALLLRPLPYREPQHLAWIREVSPEIKDETIHCKS